MTEHVAMERYTYVGEGVKVVVEICMTVSDKPKDKLEKALGVIAQAHLEITNEAKSR